MLALYVREQIQVTKSSTSTLRENEEERKQTGRISGFANGNNRPPVTSSVHLWPSSCFNQYHQSSLCPARLPSKLLPTLTSLSLAQYEKAQLKVLLYRRQRRHEAIWAKPGPGRWKKKNESNDETLVLAYNRVTSCKELTWTGHGWLASAMGKPHLVDRSSCLQCSERSVLTSVISTLPHLIQ